MLQEGFQTGWHVQLVDAVDLVDAFQVSSYGKSAL